MWPNPQIPVDTRRRISILKYMDKSLLTLGSIFCLVSNLQKKKYLEFGKGLFGRLRLFVTGL